MFRKGVFPYEYMNDWEKFNETSLPEKQDFYDHLNMKDITHADYAPKKVFLKSMKWKIRRISLFVYSRRYIIASWCIWEL